MKKKKVEMEEGGQDLVLLRVAYIGITGKKVKKVYENFEHKPNAVPAGNFAFDRGFDI